MALVLMAAAFAVAASAAVPGAVSAGALKCNAAASNAAASKASLDAQRQDSSLEGLLNAYRQSKPLRHAAGDNFSGPGLDHQTAFNPDPHPVRYATDLRPTLKLPTQKFPAPDPKYAAAPPRVQAPKPSLGLGQTGSIGALADNVQMIVDRYDAATWRPVAMGDGGGVEFRMIFGAKQVQQ